MKLRMYFLLASTILIGIFIGIFSYQARTILWSAFYEINTVHEKNIYAVANTIITSKAEFLSNSTRVLSENNELASAFVLGKESRDQRLTRSKLEKIEIDGGFDWVDILELNGTPIRASLDDLKIGAFQKGVDTTGAMALTFKGKMYLVSISSLNLFGERVAYILLGYHINPLLHSELTGISEGRVQLVAKNPTSGGNQVRFPLSSPIKFADGRPLALNIELSTSSFRDINSQANRSLLWLGVIGLVAIAILVYLFFDLTFVNRFKSTLGSLDRAGKAVMTGKLPSELPDRQWITEISLLIQSFNRFARGLAQYDAVIKRQSRESAETQKQVALAKLARQVAHDIRSPLCALQILSDTLREVPEETRQLAKTAIARINDIASNLLHRNGKLEKVSDKREKHEVVALLHSILLEKRVQFQQEKISIELNPKQKYGLFVDVSPQVFKSVLSNLINNAAEAMKSGGQIEIAVGDSDNLVRISIVDEGIGIPPHILSKLGSKELTHGKLGGSGIGVYHAKKWIGQWGGQLHFNSKVGGGTRVEISLPKVVAPPYFLPELRIQDGAEVVILDDDPSIHQIWKRRFEESGTNKVKFHVTSFNNASQFMHWYETHKPNGRELYLCDHELRQGEKTGVQIIESLSIRKQAVLVTSLYEDSHLCATCEQLQISLLPKILATKIPITIY